MQTAGDEKWEMGNIETINHSGSQRRVYIASSQWWPYNMMLMAFQYWKHHIIFHQIAIAD